MRAAQETLTPEAASVLNHSLSLASKRRHALVSPLHVVEALLSSGPNLFRRACEKSLSLSSSSSHPLQCRALVVCFNVALNRLPLASSGDNRQPCLSNALIAALKRAQKGRGSEVKDFKVELAQLVLSILDDPTVSKVMKEAGFSSGSVKACLEDASVSSSDFPRSGNPRSEIKGCLDGVSVSSPVFLFSSGNPRSEIKGSLDGTSVSSPSSGNPRSEILGCLDGASVSSPPSGNPRSGIMGCLDGACVSSPVFPPSGNPRLLQIKEDVKVLIDVLMGNKERTNCVIVGESVLTEGVVAGLFRKWVEGDVAADLKSAQFIHFQFSSAKLRFMKKEEVELNLFELRRSVDAIVSASGGGGGVIMYIGDLKWTTETQKMCNNYRYSYSPVDHLVGEIGRLLRSYSNSNAKVWLLATASFRTYLNQPPLDVQWLLEPLFVPSTVLGLKLNPARMHDTNRSDSCPECMAKFQEEEAAVHKYSLRVFPITDWTKNQGEKDNVLKRKWSSIYEELHPQRHDEDNVKNYYSSSYPWLPSYGSSILNKQSNLFDLNCFPKNIQSASSVPQFRRQQSCSTEFNGDLQQNVSTTLSLGNSPVSNDAAADKSTEELVLCTLLQEDVPWQSSSIPTIVRTLISSKEMKRATWFLIKGDDIVGKRILARGIAQVLQGSSASLINMNFRNMSGKNCDMLLKRALVDRCKLVLLLENVDFLDVELSEFLEHVFRYGMGALWNNLERNSYHPVFILTKSDDYASSDLVVQMEILVSKGASSATAYRDSTVLNKIPRKEHNSLSFLHLIKTLVFNTNPVEVKKMREMFLSNITGSFEQVFGTRNLDCFSVQEKVEDSFTVCSKNG